MNLFGSNYLDAIILRICNIISMTNNKTSCYSQTQSTNGQIDLHNIIEETEQNREEGKKLMKKIMWTESERASEWVSFFRAFVLEHSTLSLQCDCFIFQKKLRYY